MSLATKQPSKTPSNKPLPSLPTLSIQGCAHFRRLVHANLAEQDFSNNSGIQEWAVAIEGALDDLVDKIGRGRGDWLAGILKARLDREASSTAITAPEDVPTSAKAILSEAALPDLPAASRLHHIRDLLAKPQASKAEHLMLCVSRSAAAGGSIACNFLLDDFSPILVTDDDGSCINSFLFDLVDAKTLSTEPTIIGGSFAFQGVTSNQHDGLVKVLRIAVYTYLSLIIEQDFLSDSQVILQFAKPQPPPPIPAPEIPHGLTLPVSPPPRSKHRSRHSVFSIPPGGILAYFSKKTESLLHRTTSLRRTGSIDARPSAFGSHNSQVENESFSPGVLRAFSLAVDNRTTTQRQERETQTSNPATFSNVLDKLRNAANTLSTSPDISFAPPRLLTKLAAEEDTTSNPAFLSIRGDDKVGLGSIIGWNGRRDQGRGMIDSIGFARHQEISVLESMHVKLESDGESSEDQYGSCGRPKVVRFRYYASPKEGDENHEECLGSAIRRFCQSAEDDCRDKKCTVKKGAHETRLCHNGVRVVINVHAHERLDEKEPEEEEVNCWMSCTVCKEVSSRSILSAGAQLLSFGKFLEILIYSQSISILTPPLCEHTTPSPDPPDKLHPTSLPASRLNISRHFEYRKHRISIRLSLIENIFELRVPALQIVKHQGPRNVNMVKGGASQPDKDGELEKQSLRREIKAWWEGLADHIDILENAFPTETPHFRKALPRLPSVDDPMENPDSADAITPKAHVVSLPSVTEELPKSDTTSSVDDQHLHLPEGSSGSLTPTASTLRRTSSSPAPISDTLFLPLRPTSAQGQVKNEPGDHIDVTLASVEDKKAGHTLNTYAESLRRLTALRHHFQGSERGLYTLLGQTPISSLNDVRASFHSTARGASRRLQAWQTKHVPKPPKGSPAMSTLNIREPGWWNKSSHPIPGSNVIVRDDDWGSIIAFTLGSWDYNNELSGMSTIRSGMTATSTTSSVPSTPATTAETNSSFFSGSPYKLFSSTTKPDPDDESLVWHEPESFSSVISRKEHPRDHASLLSLSRTTRPGGMEGSTGGPSTITSGGSTLHNVGAGLPPPSSTKPTTQEVNNAEAVISDTHDRGDGHSTESGLEVPSLLTPSEISESEVSNADVVDVHIRRANVSSVDSNESDSTVGPEDETTAPLPPPKDDDASPGKSSFTSSVANTITSAMRFVLNNSDASAPPVPVLFRNHHNPQPTDSLTASDRPHIKYDWVIGKRMKFSCTVYFAQQFDTLRRRCGIEDVFLASIGKSANWNAEGGKSKSNFWKTHDNRFIIKTLVNAWNVADLQVLLDLAPAYFRYVDSTAGEPTVLAKLIGFYTVQVKNLETNSTHAKADVLVMENLFYGKNITKTFDLKGIQGRRVKPASNPDGAVRTNKTLFDGDWIESQERTLMLVQPYSKVALRAALKNDSDFLAKSNIMDYSLLVGIDDSEKQISCGLVDTVGSYTFAKTLEYKAKQGLNTNGKEVTVIPPAEYQERFVSALDRYILPCPDKWAKYPGTKDSSKIFNVLW